MSDEEERPYYLFKVCILGVGAVGKTCLAKRLCYDAFDLNTKVTIGIDFYTYDIPIVLDDGKETFTRMSIWDFGGQEQFKMLFPYYIGGSNGIIMAFSLINLQTLLGLEWWYEKLFELMPKDIPRIFIGTKKDLIDDVNDLSVVDSLIIKQFMKRFKEDNIIKTSSKENFNVKQAFLELTKKMLARHGFTYKSIG